MTPQSRQTDAPASMTSQTGARDDVIDIAQPLRIVRLPEDKITTKLTVDNVM